MTKKEKWIEEQVVRIHAQWLDSCDDTEMLVEHAFNAGLNAPEFKEDVYTIVEDKCCVRVRINKDILVDFWTFTNKLTKEQAKAAAENFVEWAKENL